MGSTAFHFPKSPVPEEAQPVQFTRFLFHRVLQGSVA
jgi:hypothetical protein